MAFLIQPGLMLYILTIVFAIVIEAAVLSPKQPLLITTSHITTLIVPASACYIKTRQIPSYDEDCPALTNCLPTTQCLALLTTTIPVPPIDPQCVTTPTTTLPGPCRTCVNNCVVQTSTLYQTVDSWPPTQTQAPQQRNVACATTVWRSASAQMGFTFTYRSLTQTRLSLVDCKGCSLVISDVYGGVGPGITRTTTVIDTRPAVVTSYTCQ
ncbi:hypothetical protein HYFRA_00006198 [Hymenoscyphus fraxineus]|uniref:Uncharacterized protein n=1 Tax=Hymenoscyphus fraxineus TaxID=746836 RepID=A0A9N9L7H5_9HELO|nr:hypothetical protein HYFRA_00006198 [Hymenoscyphus fraxineus]